MPNKNPKCSKCGYKMKFSKWLESTGKYQPYSRRIIWKLEVKCPNCGETVIHWRPRVDSGRGDEMR